MQRKFLAFLSLLLCSIGALSAASLNLEKIERSDKEAMEKVLAENRNIILEKILVYSNLSKFEKNDKESPLAVVIKKKRITAIRLWNAQISDLKPFGGFSALEHLDLIRNNIRALEGLNSLSGLKYLQLNYNKISEIDSAGTPPNIEQLWLTGNEIAAYGSDGELRGFDNMRSLTTLCLSRNTVTTVKGLENCSRIEILFIDNPKEAPVYDAYTGKVTSKMTVSFSDFESLEMLKNLKTLDLGGNPFLVNASVLSSLASLERVYLPKTSLMQGLDTFASFTDLQYLDISDTPLGASLNIPDFMSAPEKAAYKKLKARGVKIYF